MSYNSTNIDWEMIKGYVLIGSFIVAILALIVSVVFNFWLRKWQYKIEYKIKFIDEIYPPLIKEFKKNIEEYKQLWNQLPEPNIKFIQLDNFFLSGRIEYINSIDNDLYNSLIKVKDELIPKINDIMKIRRDIKRCVIDEWEKHLLTYTRGGFQEKEFATKILEKSIKYIAKSEFDKIGNVFENELKVNVENHLFKKNPFNVDTPKKMIEIAKTQFSDILNEDKILSKKIEDIIEKGIIVKMIMTLKNPI